MPDANTLASAVLKYSYDGEFPDRTQSSLLVEDDILPNALQSLESAKVELEVGVVHITRCFRLLIPPG